MTEYDLSFEEQLLLVTDVYAKKNGLSTEKLLADLEQKIDDKNTPLIDLHNAVMYLGAAREHGTYERFWEILHGEKPLL